MEKIKKTDKEWREQLTPEQYRIMRQKGTEPQGTGKYLHEKRRGVYLCAACGQRLFHSDAKFDSGSGWPSFWEPAESESVDTELDASTAMPRTEVLCSRCESHLGHVFDDGPLPTGMRYCIDSEALDLDPEDKSAVE